MHINRSIASEREGPILRPGVARSHPTLASLSLTSGCIWPTVPSSLHAIFKEVNKTGESLKLVTLRLHGFHALLDDAIIRNLKHLKSLALVDVPKISFFISSPFADIEERRRLEVGRVAAESVCGTIDDR